MKRILIAFFFTLSLGFLFSSKQSDAAIPTGEPGSSPTSCQNLWWKDDTHLNCSQKKFCGAYMYEGLQTSETKEGCQKLLGLMYQDFITEKPQPWYTRVFNYIRSFIAQIFPVQQSNRQTPPLPPGDSPEGKSCGGIVANLPEYQCPTGYRCQLDGNYPDAAGRCVKSGLFGF